MTDFIGTRIEQAIKLSGKSKADISREIGVTAQSVGSWIKSGTISKRNLLKLCEATGCSERWLILGGGTPPNEGQLAINEEQGLYDKGIIINEEISEVIQYLVTHSLNKHYEKLPPAAQVKFILELYSTAYKDRALLDAAPNMLDTTLLKMVNG